MISLKKLGLVGIVGLTLAGGVLGDKYHHFPRYATPHRIVKGDTIYDLGRKYGVRDISEYNQGVDPNNLQIGSTIWIPEKIIKNYLPPSASESGLEDIKDLEKFSPSPYRDPAHSNKWSIGFGHQIRQGEKFTKITEEEALELFRKDIKIAEEAIREYVWVELSQKEYDGLLSFIYTIGVDEFKNSTLLKLLNEEKYASAMDELPKWIKSGGIVVPGLVQRRDKERDKMFFGIVGRDPEYFRRLEETDNRN